jgi:WD40 repeat protein
MRLTPVILALGFWQHIEIWTLESRTQTRAVPTGVNVYVPLAVSNRFIAFCGDDPISVRINRIQETNVENVKAADDLLAHVKFSKDESLLACANADGKIVRVFETETNGCVGKFKRGGFTNVIHSLDFSPDNRWLAVLSQSGTIHFFDVRNKMPLKSVPTVRANHKIVIGQMAVSMIMWSEVGLLIVATMDGILLAISLDQASCHEVGRSQVSMLRRLAEELEMPT